LIRAPAVGAQRRTSRPGRRGIAHHCPVEVPNQTCQAEWRLATSATSAWAKGEDRRGADTSRPADGRWTCAVGLAAANGLRPAGRAGTCCTGVTVPGGRRVGARRDSVGRRCCWMNSWRFLSGWLREQAGDAVGTPGGPLAAPGGRRQAGPGSRYWTNPGNRHRTTLVIRPGGAELSATL
jgi:hypothetical protein